MAMGIYFFSARLLCCRSVLSQSRNETLTRCTEITKTDLGANLGCFIARSSAVHQGHMNHLMFRTEF